MVNPRLRTILCIFVTSQAIWEICFNSVGDLGSQSDLENMMKQDGKSRVQIYRVEGFERSRTKYDTNTRLGPNATNAFPR